MVGEDFLGSDITILLMNPVMLSYFIPCSMWCRNLTLNFKQLLNVFDYFVKSSLLNVNEVCNNNVFDIRKTITYKQQVFDAVPKAIQQINFTAI